MQGGCACGHVRYELLSPPMWVNCCHCTWCQRESGSAFAVNALVETDRISLHASAPEAVATPSPSGKGQTVLRCPVCQVAVWSHYAGSGPKIAFVRAGALDAPNAITPDIHIYASTKRPWVQLPPDARVVPEFFNPRDVWPPETMSRFLAAVKS
jgi:hypothetical protein